jgi:hypothetical protein
MQQYFDTLTDDSGNALLGATVAVTAYPSGSATTIYQSNGTTQPVANSTVVADITGQVNFFAPDGAYILTYSYKGTQYKIRSPVQLADPMAFVAATDSGPSANNYAVTSSVFPAQKYVGLKLEIKAANTNTGASTLTFQGDAGFAITQPGGSSLQAGMIQANGLARFEWDGTEWQLIGAQSQPFYPIVQAETTAGVTPVNQTYPVGNVLRYGNNTTPGTTDMHGAIVNAHAVALAGEGITVLFPAGTYYCSAGLGWSPDIPLRADGSVFITTNITTGNFWQVSSQFGAITPPAAVGTGSTTWMSGRFTLVNTNGSGANTCIALFQGSTSGSGSSCINLKVNNLTLMGWFACFSYGTNCYCCTMDQFYSVPGANKHIIWLQSGFTNLLERMVFTNCTITASIDCINAANTGLGGEFHFVGCSFDYAPTILANTTMQGLSLFFTDCHLENNGVAAFFNPVGTANNASQGVSIFLENIELYQPSLSFTNAVIANMGANSFIKAAGISATASAATMFVIAAASVVALIEPLVSYNGSGYTLISNTGGGSVNNYPNLGVIAATQVASYSGTKSGITNGSSVNIIGLLGGGNNLFGILSVASNNGSDITTANYSVSLSGGGAAVASITALSTQNFVGANAFVVGFTAPDIFLTNNGGSTTTFTWSLIVFSGSSSVTLL